ncbi:hypothetical protein Tco_0461260 [Tanacetum coccineum]
MNKRKIDGINAPPRSRAPRNREAYTKNLTNLTELLTLVKNFDFPGLKTTIDSLKVDFTTQNDHLAKWDESSASMA